MERTFLIIKDDGTWEETRVAHEKVAGMAQHRADTRLIVQDEPLRGSQRYSVWYTRSDVWEDACREAAK